MDGYLNDGLGLRIYSTLQFHTSFKFSDTFHLIYSIK
jgi:hypothetical protein